MVELSSENMLFTQIKLVRKYLKLKIIEDNVSFRGHNQERTHVYDLMKRSIVNGESHSALIIGPRGCGKTTLINSVLNQLSKEVDLDSDAIIVKLNGLIHHDDKIALKSITAQMQLENAVGDRVFGTFAENLSFLLSCLQSDNRNAKSVVFLLQEFHMFCKTGRTQTLLYNLFDVTHNKQAPMCVLEKSLGDVVPSFIAENLSFLLSCLQSDNRNAKSVVFLLQEFHMFCKTGRTQTLLYNLFDVTHNKQAPMCVLGVTNQIDVMELLEKRVKSRFSHRHIFIFPNEETEPGAKQKSPLGTCTEVLIQLLSMPSKKEGKKKGRSRKKSTATEEMETDQHDYSIPEEVLNHCKVNTSQLAELDPGFVEDWNAHIQSLASNEKVIDSLEKLCYYTVNEQIFRNILFQLVSQLSPSKPFIDASDLSAIIDKTVAPEHRVKMLQSLSILELSLVIAMKHGLDIFDGQPMNFEMILHRYTKFANTNSSSQTVPRPVILKAFEHLQELEIIMPVRNTDSIYNTGDTTASRVQKEYKLYTLAVPIEDISEAVKTFKALPTEINHWYNNSVV